MRAQASSRLLHVLIAAAILSTGLLAAAATAQPAEDFNESGNIVIADQFNNRVIEIERDSHRIVWQFGDGSDTPGPHSIVGTNDAERFGSYTLISGTGIPPSGPPQIGRAHV